MDFFIFGMQFLVTRLGRARERKGQGKSNVTFYGDLKNRGILLLSPEEKAIEHHIGKTIAKHSLIFMRVYSGSNYVSNNYWGTSNRSM